MSRPSRPLIPILQPCFMIVSVLRSGHHAIMSGLCGVESSLSSMGGFFDITADFTVYGATVVGVVIGAGGPLWPFLLVLLAYYVNGTALLPLTVVPRRPRRSHRDDRRPHPLAAAAVLGTAPPRTPCGVLAQVRAYARS